MQIRIAGLVPESVVDGPGIRLVVFCQGCPHACPGCHNPETHDPRGGELTTTEDILAQFTARPLLTGLTLSGGEPFAQAAACAELARTAKAQGRQVLVYSGYTWEELRELAQADAAVAALLDSADLLIDGPFVQEQRAWHLAFRGSANQRVIDLPRSLALGRVVERALGGENLA